MAFVAAGRAQIRMAAERGSKNARTLLALKSNPERILSVIQVGITLVGAVAAAVSGAGAEDAVAPVLMRWLPLDADTAVGLSIALIVLPLTYLNVVFGELIPKTISLKKPMTIALAAAPWLKMFDRIFSPLISLLENSTKLVMAWIGMKAEEPAVAAEEFVDIGGLKNKTREYVLNTINAEKKRARDVMLPWGSVNFVRRSDPLEKVEEVALRSGHTRLPVYDEGNVVGLVHTKEFMALLKAGQSDWRAQIRPILRFRAGEPILAILQRMQESRSHMAAVYEQMDVVGIVALEDIMEEIVGDLFDEDDDGKVRRFIGRIRR